MRSEFQSIISEIWRIAKLIRAARGVPVLLMVFVCTLGFPFSLIADRINVFAAASLTDCLKEVGAIYEKREGDRVVFNFAASSFLERQMEEGAPADVFCSADEAKMDRLEQLGLLAEGTRRSLLSNTLVIVIPMDSLLEIQSPEDLAGPEIKRLALAEPRTVPAGIYSRKYLEQTGLWAKVKPKVIPTANVRAALAAVESGNVDAGMVYRTDAAISDKVRVAYEIPRADGPAISYPMAALKDARSPEAARRFLEFLESEEAVRIFEKFGFTVLPSPHER